MRNEDTAAGRTDPLVPCLLIAGIFFLLTANNIGAPAAGIFDEGFYIPAAKQLLQGIEVTNREHPMLGKEILAASIRVFNDSPGGWRIPSLLAGTLGILASMRTMWWLTFSRAATLTFGVLLSTCFMLNSLSRVGTLDAIMFAFTVLAGLFLVKAMRLPDKRDRYLAACGVAIGLSLATKWSLLPLLPVIGLIAAAMGRFRFRHLAKYAVFLGAIPMAVYFATFAPGFFVSDNPLTLADLLPLQPAMAKAIAGYEGPSPYPAEWWEWILDIGPYWPVSEHISGAYRYLVIAGNPVSTLLAAAAIVVSLAIFVRRRDYVLGTLAILYAIPVLLSAASARVPLIHHYLLPLICALAALSILLARAWESGTRWPLIASLGASLIAFAWFYPALTALPFAEPSAQSRFDFLPGWKPIDRRSFVLKRPPPSEHYRMLRRCLDEPRNAECWN